MAVNSNSAVAHEWTFDAPVLALDVNRRGDWAAATLGDGSIRLFAAAADAPEFSKQPEALHLHDGISLSLHPDADGNGFLSGGDDGKLLIVDPKVEAPTPIAEHSGQWIDHVASSKDGHFRAYSVGKKVFILDAHGKAKLEIPLSLPSSPGGLAFSNNSKRLAISHYNGVSLLWLNAKDATPATLDWKGSHLNLIWSPDDKSLMTSMQDNALHGWIVADGKEMRMQGYATKIQSMSFTPRGKFLATSGAEQVICWSFVGGGPWGKTPLTLGAKADRIVSRVAAHPRDEMVAAGYDDGMVILAPLDGRMEVTIHPPSATPKAAIVGLAWNKEGDALFAASESGTVRLFTLDSVRNALVPAG